MPIVCQICGKKLTKKWQRKVELLDRFLSTVLADRKVGSMAWCSKCVNLYENTVPEGFGVTQWRDTMAIFSAGCLLHFLEDEENQDTVEPLVFSQLVFLNLLNGASDRTMKAALKKAEKGQDWVMEALKK